MFLTSMVCRLQSPMRLSANHSLYRQPALSATVHLVVRRVFVVMNA